MDESRDHIAIHRAAWVAPADRPPIPDGAVATRGGIVLEVGPYGTLKHQLSGCLPVRDHGDAALVPAAVNAHTHLELTALQGRIPLPQEGFPSWIQHVFRHRPSLDEPSLQEGLQRGLAMLRSAGTILCGDIANGTTLLNGEDKLKVGRHAFLELIGFDCASLDEAMHRVPGGAPPADAMDEPRFSLAAHAVYSTSRAVVRQAKDWCRSRGKIFSMHVSEHEHEMELLRTGGGYCRELLQALGRWVDGWAPPGLSPVAFLDSLGVLDAKTLLVHAVHFSLSDWEKVASRGCTVCFCPRSNHNLKVGKPDIHRALQMSIPAALGTDSLASNHDLSLFAEAAFVLDHDPEVSPDALLAMMTTGGARALGYPDRFGSLTPGKSAAMIAVPAEPGIPAGQLSETIIHKAAEGALKWALGPESP